MDWVFTQADIDAWDRAIFGEKEPEVIKEHIIDHEKTKPVEFPKKKIGRPRGSRNKNPIDKDSLSRYKRLKIKILREMCITVTADEEDHLRELCSMEDIDRYVHSLIMSKL